MLYRIMRACFALAIAVFALNAMADDSKPPLVVEAGKYSYTFALPAGWEVSAEEAKRLKVPLMMFPQNRSFTQSASIVFIDEYCKTPCANPAEPVRSILAHAKTRDSDFKSQTLPPMQTGGGSAIDLRIIDSTINKRPVREAFAFINNPGSTLVMARLAVGDLAVWDRDFKAFMDTLAGFQFFDCSAAGKGRSLGMCGPEPEVKIDPTSFEGRAAIAKALYATPDGEAYRKLVNQYLAARHSKTMRNCFDTTQDPWTANFELVGFIDKTGSLTDAVVRPESNIATCFATGLLNSIFPFAPKLPEGGDLYPIYMEVRLQP